MKLVKVAAAVLNQTPLAWDENKANILLAIEQARSENVSILCLPELCITGYGCEDAFQSPGIQAMAWQVLAEIIPSTQGMIVSLGLPVMYQGGLFNAACLVVDGKIAGFVCKQNLAGDGIHYEPRWFKPWPVGVCGELTFGEQSSMIGDVIFDCGGIRIGFEICEDAWVGERPGNALAHEGVDVILNPSASHFAFGKHDVRQRFVLEGSRAFHVTYIYANLLGNEAGRAIYDGDAMIASGGELVGLGPRFSYEDMYLTSTVIDVDETRMRRARTASFHPQVEGNHVEAVRVEFEFADIDPVPHHVSAPTWERSEQRKEEEFARAVALGLFDYVRKSYSRGVVVSLSGGADSAAVATLASLMIRFAESELGLVGVQGKLDFIPGIQDAVSTDEVVRRLVTCVYQSTRNSTEVTRSAARDVASCVAAEFLEFDVDSIVQQYREIVAGGIQRELTWERDDIALQNIQARARAPGVWMLANIRGALLLSTSNRSEAAVGYATMDGDTSGGLAPIAGIDKAFLRRWLIWMEQHGPSGLAPLTALSGVNRQQPTAELRPPNSGQTDETDLMPYNLLDAIERCAILDKLVPVEVLRYVEPHFPQYSRQQLIDWIERFFRLWCRNQWKRERYAPSFHLDDENLDPKTWCRFPILSGGFRRELAALRRLAETE